MSKLVAFAAIQGGYKVVSTAEGLYKKALDTYNADTKIGFPNTAYYLPVIYSLTGMKVETLEDLKKPLEFARGLLPPHVKGKNHLPYLGPLLDAGMGAIFSYEIMEALRMLDNPDFYHPEEDPDIDAGKIWVGPADDTILRKRGVEFVDGSAPGFAAMVGAAPNPEIAKDDRRRVPAAQPLHLLRGQPQRHHAHRAAPGSRRADRLEHPYRSLRSGHLLGRLRPRVRQPCRHGLWRRAAR
jgi:acetyl-CoA synthase